MFIEERLDLGITYGTTATITTSTAIVETFSGTEIRSINWVYPLLKFNIGQKGCLNQELEYFLAFHAARKGAYEGFRFKDWADYEFNTVITLNANKQAQLFKQYSVAESSVKRSLSKIVIGTVLVFINNVAVTQGWSLNYNTGVITFDAIPTGTIRVSGEFDVPVRFESDKINLRFQACEPGTGRKLFNWEGLTLTEVKLLPTIPLAFDLVPQFLNHRINLGYDYDSIGGNEFATRIEKLVSGHETRISEWTTNRGSWEVGSRTLLKSELDYLIALFRVCRGKAVSFVYFDWGQMAYFPVRFGEDAIAFRFDAYELGTKRVLFNLAGIPIVATGKSLPRPENATRETYLGLTAATGLAGFNPTGSRHRILSFTFNGKNLLNPNLLQLNGNASFTQNILQLTPAANSQAGSAFWIEPLTNPNSNWSVFFTYEIIANSRYDGIAFVITNSISGINSLTPGGGIGYLGISPRLAIEFDTFFNSIFNDPNNNHIALNTAGRTNLEFVIPDPGIDLVGIRFVWIENTSLGLKVYLSENEQKPASPILTEIIDINFVIGVY